MASGGAPGAQTAPEGQGSHVKGMAADAFAEGDLKVPNWQRQPSEEAVPGGELERAGQGSQDVPPAFQ